MNKYVVELKRLATTCKFGNFLKDALWDRLVCGLINTTSQKKLLTEKELSFDKALQLAVAFEMANKQAQELHAQPKTNLEVKKMTATRPKQVATPKKNLASTVASHASGGPGCSSAQKQGNGYCYRCSGQHSPRECTFKGATCCFCNKVGHISKACRKKQHLNPNSKETKSTKLKSVKHLATDTDSDELDSYLVYTISSVSSSAKGITVTVDLGGSPVEMELDTGSIISEKAYHQQLSSRLLEPSSVN